MTDLPTPPSPLPDAHGQPERNDAPKNATPAPQHAAPAASATTKPPRLQSLDAFRGLTMGAMVLVNNPGSWSFIYPPLKHATWHGCTPTDLIFPFFLFIVGVSMAFSFASRDPGAPACGLVPLTRSLTIRILRRAALLFALGMLLAVFGPLLDGVLKENWRGLSTIRIPGVLQRIAICFAIASVIVLTLSVRVQIIIGAALLLAYTIAMLALAPSADPFASTDNLCRTIDLAILGPAHVWSAQPTDPEGLFSTLPALVTTLIGFWVGLVLRRTTTDASAHTPVTNTAAARLTTSARSPRRTLNTLAILAAALLLSGYALSDFMPLNKTLWTPTYVLYTAGIATATLGAMHLLIDLLRLSRWSIPLQILGLNAILLFVGSGLVGRVLTSITAYHAPIDGDLTLAKPVSLKAALYESLTFTGLSPIDASLTFALFTLACWFCVLWYLWQRRWFWKV
ncbi:MAG: hypothetical protein K2X32_14115 [Phycisphaerales bacterium]|nr:hypothetical protein [Phycisphaerales bacterium]